MNLRELDNFNLGDAVKFHDELNPAIFDGDYMKPEVRMQLLLIAEDFVDHLGINHLDIEDITISGSSAAYSYTPHSDIDLHILVDMSKFKNDDVYRELFDAKKVVYNDAHDITIGGFDVELYVQDTNQPVVSLGEYSVKDDKWIRLPRKRRANFDQAATKAKYSKLYKLAEFAVKSSDAKKIQNVLRTIKKYRQAGLDLNGEFGPENLAYKALRTKGVIAELYKKLDELHSKKLSLPESVDPLIKEVLNTPATNVVWDTTDTDLVMASFTASNGVPYELNIVAPYVGPDEINPYEIFGSDMPDSVYDRARFVEFEVPSDKPYVRGKQGIEGTGSAAEVFGIVTNALMQYVKKYKPSMLYFQGAEPNRARLYATIAKRMLQGMPGWGLTTSNNGHHLALYNKRIVKSNPVTEASGYIPSEKEKNDKRFKTALTVDVRPDAIKKNAKAFGFKVTRAGIPPLLRK